MANRKNFRNLLIVCAFVTTLFGVPSAGASPAATGVRSLDPQTQFYVPDEDHGAHQQIVHLRATHQDTDAALLQAMVDTPQAIWFTSGTPQRVGQDVTQVVRDAARKNTVPVLVAYNVPGRDCSQYSAGGAPDGNAYRAWIDGFASGLGSNPAVVLLEPDGLALLPTDCGQPDTYNRVSLINYAAHALQSDPNAYIYLDAGHSAWHAVGDMAVRLAAGGAMDVQGFFSNVSNYRLTNYEDHFGTWISECIAFANDPEEGGWRLGHYDWCASQYYSPNGPVDPNDITTWHYSDDWYTANMGHAVPTSALRGRYEPQRPGTVGAPPHPARRPAGLVQPSWPRSRTTSRRQTRGMPLVDAFLWVKIPGESDGGCYRWTSGPTDPVRNVIDPAAGGWFADMALELAHNANPPLPIH